MTYPKYFVDQISKVQPDKKSGIVKLTFSASDDGKVNDEVQLIIPVDALNNAFREVGETMRKSFGQGGGNRGGPGGPGGPGGGRGPQGKQRPPLKDLTE